KVRAIVKASGINVPQKVDIEISHHLGLDRFEETGCTILNFINREYCKKLIICLPGQRHPEQYHKLKEEAFHIVYGKVDLTLNGETKEFVPGDIVVVERGMKHEFRSREGAIIEEISSTHYKNDSFYTDPKIGENKNRKTEITYWI
ncbi:MAG: cupin domain-containing protein, partial [Oligoflexales bacterium]|nr:cupin domain-containing protein [Oligoflexales bacterium]